MSGMVIAYIFGDMTKVYRVQNKDGKGPYRNTKEWSTHDHDSSYKTPLPSKDFGSAWYHQEKPVKFGFRTMAQLRGWFTKRELGSLEKLGFTICRLMVEKIVLESSKQVAFEMECDH